MAANPEHPTQRRCLCGGANPNCLQCGGTGILNPAVRAIMAGPAAVRRRLPVTQVNVVPSLGPPEPTRCPHCGLEVLHLAVHAAEAHPEQIEQLTAAEREAREQEAARQALVAAEIARREAEAAQRKAEARARRQEVEGPQSVVAGPGPAPGIAQPKPPRRHDRPADSAASADASGGSADAGPPGRGRSRPSGSHEEPRVGAASGLARPADEAWERLRRALADRSVLTGVIRSRKPFGVFVDVGGIDGLVRKHEMPAGEAPALQDGQTVSVVVIGIREDPRRVELSMRLARHPVPPPAKRGATGPAPQSAEGPMALAFRLAREKKKHAG